MKARSSKAKEIHGISPPDTSLVKGALRMLAPGHAEARLRWLLDLAQRDLRSLDDDEWSRLEIQTVFVAMRWSWEHREQFPAPVPSRSGQRRGYRKLQAQLRALFRSLVETGRHEIHLPRRGSGHWTISRRPTSKGRMEAEAHFLGHVWLQLVLLAVRLLDQVGAQRLMVCPAEDCGRLFLAVRRQRYCSLKHSRKAAFDAWLKSRGGSRAKR